MTAVGATNRRFSVVLVPDSEDGGYIVEVPALPGLVTYGRTMDEALDMARDAIQGWIEVQLESGRPVPAESEPVQVVSIVV
jgi:predicted RNase H-like HicB family nuclease